MELTTSTLFLLRGLELLKPTEIIDRSRIVNEFGFINAYLSDVNHVSYLDCPLYLLFKPKDKEEFNEFIEIEYDTKMLKEDYDYEDGYVMLVYDFPIIYREDYNLILEGKYSQVSKKYKELFPDYYYDQGRKIHTTTYHILNKTRECQAEREEELNLEKGTLDGMELWSIPSLKNETFDILNFTHVTSTTT